MADFSPAKETVTVVKSHDDAPSGQKRVAVICTGGTLCMKPNEEGALAPSEGFLAERMLAMPEFKRPEMPACTLFEQLPLLDSSDMGPDDWIRIANTIERLYYEYDGFVIVIGTDTMAYAASALSFMLESLGKTVILTGSMLPLSVLFNDAHRNLIVSIVFAGSLDVPEVCIFMDDQLLRGNRTVKSNSTGLDAFESPNFPALAKLETGIRFRPSLVAPQPKGRFHVHRHMVTNVAVWRMIPGFDDEYIRMAIAHSADLRAIVLELYGTGNLSARKASLVEALDAAVAKGIVIVATSQCLRGSVNLGTYALGRKLEAIGVLSAYDMTTEAVVAKLSYLLSWPDMSRARLTEFMGRSLRGEVTESLSMGEEGTGHFPATMSTQAVVSKPSAPGVRANGPMAKLMRQSSGLTGGEEEVRLGLPQASRPLTGVLAASSPAYVPVSLPSQAGISSASTFGSHAQRQEPPPPQTPPMLGASTPMRTPLGDGKPPLASPSPSEQRSYSGSVSIGSGLSSPQLAVSHGQQAAVAAIDSAASLARAMQALTVAVAASKQASVVQTQLASPSKS